MNKHFSFRRRSFRFRRFTRKAYAAFASIHREVSIGRISNHICDREMLKAGRSIAACLLCCLSLNTASAADDSSVPLPDTEQFTIEEVMVVAQKAETQSQNLRVINRLSAEQIKSLPVSTVTDLLDYLPGIDARSRGVNGIQTDISIRGGSFDQTVILLNGQNMTDPQTGHYSFDIPVDIDIIDHIEVLEGTGMNMFGLSAFSGAINIITKNMQPSDSLNWHTTASVEAGSYGLFHPVLSGSFAKNNASFAASASYNQSTGYTDNTDYKTANLFFRTQIRNTSGEWNLQAGAQYKDYGANSFYSLAYPDQFDATKTGFAGLDWQKDIQHFIIRASLSYRAHHDRFELFRQTWKQVETPAWYSGHNYHLTQTASADISVRYVSAVGTTAIGIELRNENILSNVLGDLRSNTILYKIPETIYIYSKNRLNLNYYFQQTIHWRNLSASAGISGNWNSLFANNLAWGVNLGYRLPYNICIYVNANQGVRLPTFTDLYYKSATQTANPELRPEKAITTELGITWQNERFLAKTTGYYRWGRNIIDWVLFPDDDHWQSQNLTKINAAGCEIQAAYSDHNWIHLLSLSYSFCNLDKSMELQQSFATPPLSKYALDYLRHKLVAQIDHRIWRGLGAAWTLTWQQREGEYNDRNGDRQTYKPILLFDGKIYYEMEGKHETHKFRLSLEATNIIGVKYYDYGGILQPGRWIKATITAEL